VSLTHDTKRTKQCQLQKLRRLAQLLLSASAALFALAANAEEGVRTFDNLPAKTLQAKYGFATSSASLTALRLSAVRFSGPSGSFISGDGLLLTNHHVAFSCVQRLSTSGEDLVRIGFMARTRAEERPCPGAEIKHLDYGRCDCKGACRGAFDGWRSGQCRTQCGDRGTRERVQAKSGLRCEMVTLYTTRRFARAAARSSSRSARASVPLVPAIRA
jgi:Peptidase S46